MSRTRKKPSSAKPQNMSLSTDPDLKLAMQRLAEESGVSLNAYMKALMQWADRRHALVVVTIDLG